jgi:flagellar motility protein MotE (MotC chaperone)
MIVTNVFELAQLDADSEDRMSRLQDRKQIILHQREELDLNDTYKSVPPSDTIYHDTATLSNV